MTRANLMSMDSVVLIKALLVVSKKEKGTGNLINSYPTNTSY